MKNPFPKGTTEAAMWEYENAAKDYLSDGISYYEWLGDLSLEEMNYTPNQAATGLADVQSNQRLNDMELMALAELESISKEGLSARDKAEMAKLESNVNRANAGRQGAIRQQMESRGLGGSGLDFMARQQAAQDATEMEALAALEKAAMNQEGRQAATARMGALAGSMGEREYAQKARVAEAQDVINRFNTGSEIQRRQYNNQMRNEVQRYNHQGRQGVANNNVGAQNNFAADSMNTRQNVAQLQYNASVEEKNRREAARRERERQRKGQAGAILGVGGAVLGGVYGGPEGAAVGYQAGNAFGQSFAFGGEVEGEAVVPGDHPLNDTVIAKVSPGEVVIPRSIADDPNAAADFVADVKGKPKSNDADKAIEGLISAMNYLNKKRK